MASTNQHLNCQHYINGVCAHPSARRAVLGNKPCVLIGDVRVSACQYQVERDRPMPPPAPPIFNSRQDDCDVVISDRRIADPTFGMTSEQRGWFEVRLERRREQARKAIERRQERVKALLSTNFSEH